VNTIMPKTFKTGLSLIFALVLAGGTALAPEPEHGLAPERAAPQQGEPHPGPRGYERPAEPRLFALEVPPVGYEWVRDGNDAILVNTDSGEILQVEYGVFA
jgi:Nickel/cobalt transporter regulator